MCADAQESKVVGLSGLEQGTVWRWTVCSDVRYRGVFLRRIRGGDRVRASGCRMWPLCRTLTHGTVRRANPAGWAHTPYGAAKLNRLPLPLPSVPARLALTRDGPALC